MKKRAGIVIFAFLCIILIKAIYAQSCFPEYQCGDWQGCINGIEKRVCKDAQCKQSDLIERRFCKEGCTSNFQCGDWSKCDYPEDYKDVFKEGGVEAFGTSERKCFDLNGCAPGYNETAACRAVKKGAVQLTQTVICDKEYLTGLSKNSNKPIFNINLDSYKEGRFDISFVQNYTISCPACYDGIKDKGEEGIDCGAVCGNTCEQDAFYYKDFALFFWILSFFLFVILLSNIVSFNLGIYRIRILLSLGEVFLISGNLKKAANTYFSIRQVYYGLDDNERAAVKQEIYEYYHKIKEKSKVR